MALSDNLLNAIDLFDVVDKIAKRQQADDRPQRKDIASVLVLMKALATILSLESREDGAEDDELQFWRTSVHDKLAVLDVADIENCLTNLDERAAEVGAL